LIHPGGGGRLLGSALDNGDNPIRLQAAGGEFLYGQSGGGDIPRGRTASSSLPAVVGTAKVRYTGRTLDVKLAPGQAHFEWRTHCGAGLRSHPETVQ